MKINIAILLISAALIAADCDLPNYDGEPGCSTQSELKSLLFPNFWDPTHYWRCTTLNEPAVLVHCPDGFAYSHQVKACVKWIDWVWEPKVPPPSCPIRLNNDNMKYEPVATNSV